MLELENKVMEIPERERVLSLVKEGNLAELQSALTTISTIDLVDDNGITPLMAACIFRPAEPEVVSLLLESGADVEPISTHEEVITLLVRKGLNPVVTDANGWNALHCAAAHNPNTAIALLLLHQGLDLEAAVSDGRTPLALAVCFNKEPMIKMLLEQGAEAGKCAQGRVTPLLLAAMVDPHPEICQLLLDHGAAIADRDDEGMNALHMAAARQPQVAVLRTLLAAGVDRDGRSIKGYTPLMRAVAENGESSIAAFLLEAGALVNQTDDQGMNALMHAVNADRELAVINVLISGGADCAQRTNSGESVLHFAAANCQRPEVLDRLLDLCATEILDQPNKQGRTPLSFAVAREKGSRIIAILLAAGTDPNKADTDGHSPLMYAVVNASNLEAIDMLLDAGADPAQQDGEGRTAWDHSLKIRALWYTSQQRRLQPAHARDFSATDEALCEATLTEESQAALQPRITLGSRMTVWPWLFVVFLLFAVIRTFSSNH